MKGQRKSGKDSQDTVLHVSGLIRTTARWRCCSLEQKTAYPHHLCMTPKLGLQKGDVPFNMTDVPLIKCPYLLIRLHCLEFWSAPCLRNRTIYPSVILFPKSVKQSETASMFLNLFPKRMAQPQIAKCPEVYNTL